MFAVCSNYAKDAGTGCPEPYLKAIAEAGFSHVHWVQHWSCDFIYTEPEIDQIGRWLKEYGLQLLHLHASAGQEKVWFSPREYERRAGVELVANRIEMTARLGADVIVLHLPYVDLAEQAGQESLAIVRRSLDELKAIAQRRQVRIALENGMKDVMQKFIEVLLSEYDKDYLGVCYDSGHGNIVGDGLEWLDSVKHRLICIHLHDNNGTDDQHKLPLTGTIDWPGLMGIISQSPYQEPLILETLMTQADIQDEGEFLKQALQAATKLDAMMR